MQNVPAFKYEELDYTYRTSKHSIMTTIVFGFMQQMNYWYLDDIKVIDTVTGLIVNKDGGFESNNLRAHYSYCSLSQSNIQNGGTITNDNPLTGSYSYQDAAKYAPDYLIQSFETVGGRWYNVSFAVGNGGKPPNLAFALIGS